MMINICKANTTKSAAEFIFEVLKKVDQRQLDVNHIVLVPDRASLEAERQLLSSVGGSFSIQVLTFKRFAGKVADTGELRYLSKQSGIIALSQIVADNKDKLVCYTKGTASGGFVENMYETISQLKYCKITPKMLFSGIFPKSVAGKLSDIGLLYQAYQDFLGNAYLDSADKIEMLCAGIAESEFVKNSFFYLYDFDNLSVQQLQVAENLIRYSRGVTVACCASDDEYDKYLYLNDIYKNLLSVCKNLGVIPNVFSRTGHANKYTQQIGKNLYGFRKVAPISNNGFAEIFQGNTRVQEVYALACKIQQYTRSGGRYRDIYVITSDVDKYTNAISTVFGEFEIPYYCDRQFCLAEHQYAQFIIDYIAMVKNNLQLPSVLNFVKNYFFTDGSNDVYLFENYCLKYNVNYNFNEFTLGKHDAELFGGAEKTRQRLKKLTDAVTFSRVDSARSYVDKIRALIKFKLDNENLTEKNNAFAQRQHETGLLFENRVSLQAEEKFNDTLLQVEDILGSRRTTLDEFLKILTTAAASVNISAIPLLADCVVFANMAKARKHDIKFLALLGANHGQMPILKNDCKLLSDANIVEMAKCGVTLEPQIFIENKRERFSLYQLLQEPEQKLYVSYTASDGKDSLLPSSFVEQLSQMFTADGEPLKNNAAADEEVYTRRQAISKLVLSKRRLADNQLVKTPYFSVLYSHFANEIDAYGISKTKDLRVENGKELFLQNSETSVTKITDFFNCPYKFYLHYGLRVKPREVARLESNNLGDILHGVLEKYVANINIKETDDETRTVAAKCFAEVLDNDFYKGLANDAAMKNLLKQLKVESVKMCVVVKNQLKTSDFKNFAAEFGFGGKYAAKGVEVPFGSDKFVLTGVIDRVDVCDGKFIVIDYKSGAQASTFTEKDLYIGKKLQLPVYLKAVCVNFEKWQPVGFFYFNMHNDFAKDNEEKVYTYGGRVLDDAQTAIEIDNQLASGFCEKLGLKLTKKGELSKQSRKPVTAGQIDAEINYAMALIAEAGKNMQQGFISISPYDGVCRFCDYSRICDYNDIFTHPPRKECTEVSAKTIENIINKVKQG